jgi:two-component system chemotaxis response regulator CheY
MKMLVVDDTAPARIVLKNILSRYGEVHTCVDGLEAVLAHTRSLECGSPYDLICMDILMPNMGGLEALKLIRHKESIRGEFSPAKIIITTASDDEDDISQAFREICDAYIVKPIDAEQLMGLVHCLLPVEETTV